MGEKTSSGLNYDSWVEKQLLGEKSSSGLNYDFLGRETTSWVKTKFWVKLRLPGSRNDLSGEKPSSGLNYNFLGEKPSYGLNFYFLGQETTSR